MKAVTPCGGIDINKLKTIRRIANIEKHYQSFHHTISDFNQAYVSVLLIEGYTCWMISQIKDKIGVEDMYEISSKEQNNQDQTTKKKRIDKIEDLLNTYHKTEDSFEQTELAIHLIQGHMGWLIQQIKE